MPSAAEGPGRADTSGSVEAAQATPPIAAATNANALPAWRKLVMTVIKERCPGPRNISNDNPTAGWKERRSWRCQRPDVDRHSANRASDIGTVAAAASRGTKSSGPLQASKWLAVEHHRPARSDIVQRPVLPFSEDNNSGLPSFRRTNLLRQRREISTSSGCGAARNHDRQ